MTIADAWNKKRAGFFSRHQAEKACRELKLPYRKPSEWLTIDKVWKLLNCTYEEVFESLQGTQSPYNLRGIYLGLNEILWSGYQWRQEDLEFIRVHPDEVFKVIRKKQTVLLKKETRLLKRYL